MIAIGVWRHIVRRVPLRYHPSYWSLVFPLGMYGAATFKMRAVVQLDAARMAPEGHPRRSRSPHGQPRSSASSCKAVGQSPSDPIRQRR